MITSSERSKKVKYAIRDVVVLAKQVEKEKKVIYLNIGDPLKFDFTTPSELIEAVHKAMKEGHNYYSDSEGILEARQAIATHNNKLGIDTDADSVIVTLGVSEAINMCIGALLDRHENILIPRPSYPAYNSYTDLFEVGKKFHTLDDKNGWKPDPQDIEKNIDNKTEAIVIINPNNPTGSLCDKKTLKEIINIAGQHDLLIFSDEVYDELLLEGEMHHTAALSQEVPVITYNGLSKNFLAPGWRVGWMAITDRNGKLDEYKGAIHQLARARLCPNTPYQFAIKPAMEHSREYLKGVIDKLRKRRDITQKRINEIDGLSLVKPMAGFYAFPKIEGIDDKEFVTNLIKEEGVVLVHGEGFDMPGYFRIVFLSQEDVLNEAYDKIEAFMKRHRK